MFPSVSLQGIRRGGQLSQRSFAEVAGNDRPSQVFSRIKTISKTRGHAMRRRTTAARSKRRVGKAKRAHYFSDMALSSRLRPAPFRSRGHGAFRAFVQPTLPET